MTNELCITLISCKHYILPMVIMITPSIHDGHVTNGNNDHMIHK